MDMAVFCRIETGDLLPPRSCSLEAQLSHCLSLSSAPRYIQPVTAVRGNFRAERASDL